MASPYFPDATLDRYAKIDMNYYGECKLRLENGWCGLQCEVGEDNIPSVCRYYPRGIRQNPKLECSISNSCEWVIEELVKNLDPIKFKRSYLKFYFDNEEDIKIYPKDFFLKREESFKLLMNRDKSILERIYDIAKLVDVSLNFNEEITNSILNRLEVVYSHSYSIGDYMKDSNFSIESAVNNIKEVIPNIDIYVEKILINHMFFSKFPYMTSNLSLKYSINGLFFIYMFWMRLVFDNLDKNFIDLTANFFRTAEHANMYDIINNNIHRLK